jgi:hypothetical protein
MMRRSVRGSPARDAAAARAVCSEGLTRRAPGRGECGAPLALGPSGRPAGARVGFPPRAPPTARSGRCGPSRSAGGKAPPVARAQLRRTLRRRLLPARRASTPSNATPSTENDRAKGGMAQSPADPGLCSVRPRRNRAPSQPLREAAAARSRSLRAGARPRAQFRSFERGSSASGQRRCRRSVRCVDQPSAA